MNIGPAIKRKSIQMLFLIILTCAAAYIGTFLWMWTRQENYLFIPKHNSVMPAFEKYRRDQTVGDVTLQGWFLDKGKNRTVIYYGGNAEDLAGHCDVLYNGLDANTLLVNYRGYGQSEGTPSETNIIADSIELFDRFCSEYQATPASIFLMGRSLGSGVAVQVAKARPSVGGVILVTPYESIAAVASHRYPWLPIKKILRHPFLSNEYAPDIRIKALIFLAEFDESIPIESGQKLGDLWGGPKKIITLPKGHMNINEHPDYFEKINRFIAH